MVIYTRENTLNVEEFISVLRNSTLGQRRPIEDVPRMQNMLDHANLIVTARENGKLIGVARSISDFAFCTYLSDLAVDSDFQKQGIGKQLIFKTKEYAIQGKLILLSAPAAVEYYPKIGMKKFDHCFYLDIENA